MCDARVVFIPSFVPSLNVQCIDLEQKKKLKSETNTILHITHTQTLNTKLLTDKMIVLTIFHSKYLPITQLTEEN